MMTTSAVVADANGMPEVPPDNEAGVREKRRPLCVGCLSQLVDTHLTCWIICCCRTLSVFSCKNESLDFVGSACPLDVVASMLCVLFVGEVTTTVAQLAKLDVVCGRMQLVTLWVCKYAFSSLGRIYGVSAAVAVVIECSVLSMLCTSVYLLQNAEWFPIPTSIIYLG